MITGYKIIKRDLISLVLLCLSMLTNAQQDTLRYVGKTLSNIDYHHGQLSPAVGVHATQVMRASREHPQKADGFGWTYNHAPNIAYWNNTFFVNYLSNPVGEHIPPSQSLMVTSKDGNTWSFPKVIFPIYDIPDGYVKEGIALSSKNLTAVMHQRMGFFTSSNNRFFTLAYYGIVMEPKDSPNDGKGVGRVIREIYKDGSLGPIYFIRHNKSWDRAQSTYPFYKTSKDKGFIKACEELLSTPLLMQQWAEESDRDDSLIPLKKEYKAFSNYHLNDGRVVGLWKHALTTISTDNGKTWLYSPLRAPGVVNGNAKIWGQKTSDKKYATVYNPSEFRWPLAVSTSKDGLNYTDLLLVHGEISKLRYGGAYKSHGPQYVRGIVEGNGTPPDGNMWLTYSMNKEDIWVASIPVPIVSEVHLDANDVFDKLYDGEELSMWNIYNLSWGSAKIEMKNSEKVLTLRDQDPFDYVKAERVIPTADTMQAHFTVIPEQNDYGLMQLEFQNKQGKPAIQIIFDNDGIIKLKAGYRYKQICKYKAKETYNFDIKLDASSRSYMVTVNDSEPKRAIFFQPVEGISRIMFRTGEQRYEPNPDTPVDTPNYVDVPNTGQYVPEAVFHIKSLITKKL